MARSKDSICSIKKSLQIFRKIEDRFLRPEHFAPHPTFEHKAQCTTTFTLSAMRK